MRNFGFSIKDSRSDNFDSETNELYLELIKRVPSFKLCFQCGCCSATCTAGKFTDFNIRKIHTQFRRGDLDSLKSDLKACMLCGKCTLVCPRGVNLRSLIMNMREILSKSDI